MTDGDTQFVDFVQANSARLLRAAYLMTGDRHEAEDAVQTALARTYAAWHRVRNSDAYSYTRKVLANHVIDGWRRGHKGTESSTEQVPDAPTGDDMAHDVALQDWLRQALAVLSRRERTILVLRHFYDLSEAAIAKELKVSKGTVKSTNARALAKLRINATQPRPDRVATTGGQWE